MNNAKIAVHEGKFTIFIAKGSHIPITTQGRLGLISDQLQMDVMDDFRISYDKDKEGRQSRPYILSAGRKIMIEPGMDVTKHVLGE